LSGESPVGSIVLCRSGAGTIEHPLDRQSVSHKPLPDRPSHPRLTNLTGSSTDPDVVGKVDAQIGEGSRFLVALDADHSREHVLRELDVVHSRVSTGSYLIVEDTNINDHPVTEHLGPGPADDRCKRFVLLGC
jgi:cephalosporin hydroxylase